MAADQSMLLVTSGDLLLCGSQRPNSRVVLGSLYRAAAVGLGEHQWVEQTHLQADVSFPAPLAPQFADENTEVQEDERRY